MPCASLELPESAADFTHAGLFSRSADHFIACLVMSAQGNVPDLRIDPFDAYELQKELNKVLQGESAGLTP